MKSIITKAIALFFVLGAAHIGFAQQEQQYTQYMVNGYTINPAMGGTEDFTDIKIGGRAQWVGFESRPLTGYLTVHSTIGKQFSSSHNHHIGEHKYWHGVGGYLYTDNTGPLTRNTAAVSYAYNFGVSRHTRLSIGMFMGMKQFRVNGDNWRPDDPVDDLLLSTTIVKTLPDGAVGAWLYNKYFYLGASAFQIFRNKLELPGIHDALDPGRLFDHYFLTGGFRMPLNRDLMIVPSIMIKGVSPAPISVDLNARIMYNDLLWTGFSYRALESFSVMAGCVLAKQWELSYSFDLNTTVIQQYSLGSHEVIIGYRLKHPKHIDCPSRYWH